MKSWVITRQTISDKLGAYWQFIDSIDCVMQGKQPWHDDDSAKSEADSRIDGKAGEQTWDSLQVLQIVVSGFQPV